MKITEEKFPQIGQKKNFTYLHFSVEDVIQIGVLL